MNLRCPPQHETFVIWGLIRNNGAKLPLFLHVYQWRNRMTKFKMLGAVCLAAALAASSPVLARGAHVGGGMGGMHASGAHIAGGGAPFAGRGFHGGGFRGGGFGPSLAAGVVAGTVLGGAYAYGPGYYGDSYAYDNSYDSGYTNQGYTNPNGFVCQPGTWFKGEDGRPHLCQ
jgi:hypothetical protein